MSSKNSVIEIIAKFLRVLSFQFIRFSSHKLALKPYMKNVARKTIWWFLKKLNTELLFWTINLTPRYISKRTEYRHSNKNLYIDVHSSTTHNSQKVEKTQMSINWGMDKQNVVYPFNGLVFINKKEWRTVTSYDMDESWNTVWNKWNQS